MGRSAEKRLPSATYADLEAVPAHLRAELIRGVLHTFPRPAYAHTRAASRLGAVVVNPFDMGIGGPGGWVILDEPEVHLGEDVLVPDLAGWKLDRIPRRPREQAFFTVPPDWVCEVLSPSTATYDRFDKMPVYAAAGVPWAWLLDPLTRSLEVFLLDPRGRWVVERMIRGDASVRVPPFDAIELNLSSLWPEAEDEDARE
ncbi:Uma2 family endonuclease [Chondromyces crocatus]|nr:Uma2 family endonuclease [Chondromyces crocatus]